MNRSPGEAKRIPGGATRAFAAAAAALAAAMVVWPTGAEAAEARIDDFAFACTTPEGQTLKPKFGDIEGVFYSDIPAQREQCLEAIKRKIALCRQNIDFESNTKNEKHAPRLPIFKRQAEVCIDHFKSERYKCGGAPLDAGEAAKQVDEAAPADAYTVDPLDTVMEAAKRANVRSGPGTDHAVSRAFKASLPALAPSTPAMTWRGDRAGARERPEQGNRSRRAISRYRPFPDPASRLEPRRTRPSIAV